MSLNEYNLFDGSFTIELAWNPESGGKDNDHVNQVTQLASWTYKVVSNQYNIGYSNFDRVTVNRTKHTKTVTEDIVSGWKGYADQYFGSGRVLFEGSRMSVTPTTGIAHGVRVTEANTDITIMENQYSGGSSGRTWQWEA